MQNDTKAAVQKRFNRIAGQVRGLSKMVAEEILRDHVAHCVEHAINSGDKQDQRTKIAEIIDVLRLSER